MDQSFGGSRQPMATGPVGPDLRHFVLARRLFLGVAGGVLALLAGTVILLSLFATAGLPWLVGVVLAAAVIGVVVAGLHAGGHGWFVPVPVLVLAVAWAVVVSAAGWASAAAWALAALALLGAFIGFVLVIPAIGFPHTGGPTTGPAALVGASGTAVTALSPKGICRVHNETWTAESISGPLPAGAPVHVARVDGLRLFVWSESGTVPGPEALGPAHLDKPAPREKEDA